ncbi:hypothetical protein [Chondrinema litorale]|uniref:hypothetical protein n=1 Tax=Chondrinema litorale TaxID=2994555 RepID=UPI002542FCF2|nr:hypothetical protein [Chondrinema litorale]UZR98716.1 hypothetical protein OQ292_32420 [Chondrinema litorale]
MNQLFVKLTIWTLIGICASCFSCSVKQYETEKEESIIEITDEQQNWPSVAEEYTPKNKVRLINAIHDSNAMSSY